MNLLEKMVAAVLIFLGGITMIRQLIYVSLWLGGTQHGSWRDLVWFFLGFACVVVGGMIVDVGERRIPYQSYGQRSQHQWSNRNRDFED